MTGIETIGRSGKSRVRWTQRPALPAPDVFEAVLGGWADQRVMLKRLERPLPTDWEEQRKVLARD